MMRLKNVWIGWFFRFVPENCGCKFQDCRFFIFTVSHPHDFENIFPGLDYFEQAMICPDRNKWLATKVPLGVLTVAETSIIGQIPRFSDFQIV
jgi:hypothetical protein